MTLKVDLSKQVSYFGDHFDKQKTLKTQSPVDNDEEEKTLPPSQPLGQYRFRNDSLSYAAAVSPPAPGNPTLAPATIPTEESNIETEIPQNESQNENQNDSSEEIEENAVVIENVSAVEELWLQDPTILAGLPDFKKVAVLPSQDYNNILFLTKTTSL